MKIFNAIYEEQPKEQEKVVKKIRQDKSVDNSSVRVYKKLCSKYQLRYKVLVKQDQINGKLYQRILSKEKSYSLKDDDLWCQKVIFLLF
ncbi:unnamed protein product [Paramecium sonneborni]|uniref:Uncharacterized protein n=1 Tax=Paramecium sonneborni TaxID=65129 RepID=A0A8S1PE32_9CILI|nr:unnamed protein product [Paramecium sonneborni]